MSQLDAKARFERDYQVVRHMLLSGKMAKTAAQDWLRSRDFALMNQLVEERNKANKKTWEARADLDVAGMMKDDDDELSGTKNEDEDENDG